MTGRTHDLAAFTALLLVFLYHPAQSMTMGTAFVAIAANMIGGLAPDLDSPTAEIWRKIRGGRLLSGLLSPLLGGHRLFSHSLLGILVASMATNYILKISSSFLIVNQTIVWWAFMIGFVSHLLADAVTKEGVPLLFPLPFKFGLPPMKSLRMTTGTFMEKGVVFPLLLISNGYLIYSHYNFILDFLRHYLK